MRRAPKVDRNQSEIVEALRKAGAFVQSLAGVADGCPDLLVGYGGVTALVEVKDGQLPPSARRLTPDQLKWHGQWKGGPLAVVCDVESALRVLGVMCPPKESVPDNGVRTGNPPGMLQDDSRPLSRWLASKPDAMRHAREASAEIVAQRNEKDRK